MKYSVVLESVFFPNSVCDIASEFTVIGVYMIFFSTMVYPDCVECKRYYSFVSLIFRQRGLCCLLSWSVNLCLQEL